jgi:hypothetical protein
MSDTTDRERSSDFVRDLGNAVRKNPLSAALIGMGALWLFTNRFGPVSDAARNAWRGAPSAWRSGGQTLREGAQATADAVRDHGSQAVDRLSDAGNAFAGSASEYAGAAPEIVGNIFSEARANLGELFRAQPLALGAVGLAIGAAVAASLPSSEAEGTYLGESSDYVKQKAGEIAGQQTQRAVEMGKKVVDAVADEARQQGLTAEGLTAAARDLSGKVSRVVDAAAKTTTRTP